MEISINKINNKKQEVMKQSDGYNGYEGGAPYWIGPNGQKYYNYNEWLEEDRKYWRGKG